MQKNTQGRNSLLAIVALVETVQGAKGGKK